MPSRKYFIGIDFGTTNSLAAWGLLSPKGRSITPQVISFSLNESSAATESMGSSIYFKKGRKYPIVGRKARQMGRRYPSRLVRCPKRLTGTENVFTADRKTYHPADLVAIIIRRLRLQLQKELNARITGAILTAPASFGYARRKDLIDGAALAGLSLDENDVLDEPVAALLAYIDMERRRRISQRVLDLNEPKTVMILDCGGGTTDATIARLQGNACRPSSLDVQIAAISRFEELGGEDFDKEIAMLLQRSIERATGVKTDDLEADERDALRAELLYKSELFKIDFSSLEADAEAEGEKPSPKTRQAQLIKHPSAERPLRIELRYGDFLEAVKGLLDPDKRTSIHRPVQTALERAKLAPDAIDHLLVVGGMSKMRTLRKSLEKSLGSPTLQVLHSTQSVVKGAVLQHFSKEGGSLSLPRVPQLSGESIRLRLKGGSTVILIPEGVTLPYETVLRRQLSTGRKGQKQLTLCLCAGESSNYEDNQPIGSGVLEFDSPQKAGRSIGIRAVMKSDRMIALEAFLEENPEVRTTLRAGLGLMTQLEVNQRRETLFPSD